MCSPALSSDCEGESGWATDSGNRTPMLLMIPYPCLSIKLEAFIACYATLLSRKRARQKEIEIKWEAKMIIGQWSMLTEAAVILAAIATAVIVNTVYHWCLTDTPITNTTKERQHGP